MMNHFQKIPANQSIFTILKGLANNHADSLALIDEGGLGRQLSYGALFTQATLWGKLLCQDSFSGQDEIGLLSENRSEWAVAYLAILASGRTVVPIDANLKPNEITRIISKAELKTVFVSGRYEKFLSSEISDLTLISFSQDSVNYAERYMADLPSDKISLPESINDCAVLIYTSGTTGSPKTVELTHANIMANVEGSAGAIKVVPEDRFLSVLPLHHTFEGTAGFLLPLYVGCSIVYARSLKSKELIEDVKRSEATILLAVPLLFEKMYHSVRRAISKAGKFRKILFTILYGISLAGWKSSLKLGPTIFRSARTSAGLGSIRLFVAGGAALPVNVARFFNIMGFGMIQGYGMTEASPVISAQRLDDIRFGSVGPPLENLELKIDDPNSDGIGEIIVRGPSVTRGYRGNAEETAKLLVDGWLRTGDLGRMKEGHLWITGRKKNVIVSAAGKNIYPEELEERLLASMLICEVVVFGRKREGKQGEDVRAIVVPDLEQLKQEFEVSTTEPDMEIVREKIQAVIDDLNGQMADFKRIANFDIQLEELEKTSTKKVKRFLYK